MHAVLGGRAVREEGKAADQQQEGTQGRHDAGTPDFLGLRLEGQLERWGEGDALFPHHREVVLAHSAADTKAGCDVQGSRDEERKVGGLPPPEPDVRGPEREEGADLAQEAQEDGGQQEAVGPADARRQGGTVGGVAVAERDPVEVVGVVVHARPRHAHADQAGRVGRVGAQVPHAPGRQAQGDDGQDPARGGSSQAGQLVVDAAEG